MKATIKHEQECLTRPDLALDVATIPFIPLTLSLRRFQRQHLGLSKVS